MVNIIYRIAWWTEKHRPTHINKLSYTILAAEPFHLTASHFFMSVLHECLRNIHLLTFCMHTKSICVLWEETGESKPRCETLAWGSSSFSTHHTKPRTCPWRNMWANPPFFSFLWCEWNWNVWCSKLVGKLWLMNSCCFLSLCISNCNFQRE